MLAAMFSGRYTMVPSKDDGASSDRDGTHFRSILNYLRGCLDVSSLNVQTKSELLIEASYYQLQGLMELLDTAVADAAVAIATVADAGTAAGAGAGAVANVNPISALNELQQQQKIRVVHKCSPSSAGFMASVRIAITTTGTPSPEQSFQAECSSKKEAKHEASLLALNYANSNSR